MAFKKATKFESRLRMALTGPSGSGKTFSALAIATALGCPIAVIDTERGSASKYADLFDFDVEELTSFHPQRYIDAIKDAENSGYNVLIIDSLSHAWMGKDGALELVDRASKASKSQNTYVAWRDVTPLQTALVDAITGAKCHVIATMRTKTEYAQEKDDRGKTVIRKVGLAPVQRDGLEHEFDVVGEMDHQNNLMVTKTRCPDLQGVLIEKPGKEVAEILAAWLKGEKPPELPPQPPRAEQPEAPQQANGKAAPAGSPSITKTPAFRALMAWLRESEIDEEMFKFFLHESGALPADEQGELHWGALSEVNLKGVLAKQEGCLTKFRPFAAMIKRIQNEGIDIERWRDFLSTLCPPQDGQRLSLATLPPDIHDVMDGAIHDYQRWEENS